MDSLMFLVAGGQFHLVSSQITSIFRFSAQLRTSDRFQLELLSLQLIDISLAPAATSTSRFSYVKGTKHTHSHWLSLSHTHKMLWRILSSKTPQWSWGLKNPPSIWCTTALNSNCSGSLKIYLFLSICLIEITIEKHFQWGLKQNVSVIVPHLNWFLYVEQQNAEPTNNVALVRCDLH